MSRRNVPFGAPRIGPEEVRQVLATLRSGWIGPGPRAARFERQFASYLGARHAVAVASGTAALHLALGAAGIGPGDEVVTTPLTFAATANAIMAAGAIPVFADVDRATGNLDPVQAARVVTKRTRGILPVHLAGRLCEMRGIMALARRRGLVVIEDATHAIEARTRGRSAGTIGDFGCFSFTYSKNITAGEGGAVVTRHASTARRIRQASCQGLADGGWQRFRNRRAGAALVVAPGFKYTFSDLNAAIALGQLRHIGAWWKRRKAIWDLYTRRLGHLPVELPSAVVPGGRHGLHLYSMRLDLRRVRMTRDQVRHALGARGVGTGVHFVSLHMHPWYRRRFGFRPDAFPHARWISERTLSLPLSPHLSDGEVERIVHVVCRVLGPAR